MVTDILKRLKDYILQYNTYLDKGFDSIYIDSNGNVNNGSDVIFPDDTLGNYFYLRLPKNISFSYDNAQRLNDCDRPLIVNTQIILVCQVLDADPDKLMNNLLATIQRFDERIIIQSGILKSEEVVLQELAKLKKENINEALKNLDPSYTIVSLGFTYPDIVMLPKLNCLTNPCKTC